MRIKSPSVIENSSPIFTLLHHLNSFTLNDHHGLSICLVHPSVTHEQDAERTHFQPGLSIPPVWVSLLQIWRSWFLFWLHNHCLETNSAHTGSHGLKTPTKPRHLPKTIHEILKLQNQTPPFHDCAWLSSSWTQQTGLQTWGSVDRSSFRNRNKLYFVLRKQTQPMLWL